MLVSLYIQGALLILVLSNSVSAARKVSKKQRNGWTCVRSKNSLNTTLSCQQCQYMNRESKLHNNCPMDGYIFQTKLDCLIHGGCSSIMWQCVGAPKDGKCTYCSQRSGAKRPCVSDVKVFKSEIDCEINSESKCGITCKGPDEQLFRCKFKEPSCVNPIADSNIPFGCVSGCNCQPGYFRHQGKCVKPSKCPIPVKKNCFKEVLVKYNQNFDSIKGENWPHSYLQPFNVPLCDLKGNYEAVQCSQKFNTCYCVDTKNREPRPEHQRLTKGNTLYCDSGVANAPKSKFSVLSSAVSFRPIKLMKNNVSSSVPRLLRYARRKTMKGRKPSRAIQGRNASRNKSRGKRTRRNKKFRN